MRVQTDKTKEFKRNPRGLRTYWKKFAIFISKKYKEMLRQTKRECDLEIENLYYKKICNAAIYSRTIPKFIYISGNQLQQLIFFIEIQLS